MLPQSAAAAAQVRVRAAESPQWRAAWAARLMFHSMEARKLAMPSRPASIQT